MFGRENMSGSWCMWCQSHPSEWKSLSRSFPLWTIELLKKPKDKIVTEKLKEPKAICGVVNYPIWDFIEFLNYIFPELHVKIGLVNNALNTFYAWVEDHVEAASAEEKICRNKMLLTDTKLTKATEKIELWKDSGGRQLTSSQIRLSEVTNALK
jgi:hypothetical protein